MRNFTEVESYMDRLISSALSRERGKYKNIVARLRWWI